MNLYTAEKINNIFVVNGKEIHTRTDFEKLNEDEKFALLKERRKIFNEPLRKKKGKDLPIL
jgi:hypothetical protein